MKIHELQLQAHKARKRVGRGISAGGGKTAGRGTKGQKARAGGNVRPGFEGGQNPLAKRLPKKRGFQSLSRVEYQIVNLADLSGFKTAVDHQTLTQAGLVKSGKPVKLLGNGELKTKLTVKVQAASKPAVAAVEKAGGKLEITPLPKRSSAGEAASARRTRTSEAAKR